MKLTLTREDFQERATIGRLAVDGVEFCATLEDVDRKLEIDPLAKIPGATAIPRGLYRVTVDYSPHFGKDMPHVLDVPGFSGVRIHPGNSDRDTEGCILVGRRPGNDFIFDSRVTFDPLFEQIQNALKLAKDVTIEVV
jgi:Family of unknown function (DUF5675)